MSERLAKEQLDHIERISLTPHRSVVMPTMQLRQLVREHRELSDEVAEGGCARHAGQAHGQAHGREAEELRSGIERLLDDVDDDGLIRKELRRLLDDVDARDSLAYLEHQDATGAA